MKLSSTLFLYFYVFYSNENVCKTKINVKLFVTTHSAVNICENFHIFYVLLLVVAMQTLMAHTYDS